MPADPIRLSKFLSFVLRHDPGAIGLTLDPHGWADVDELIQRAHSAGTRFDHEDLLLVVRTGDKKRFTLTEDGRRIRAAQGHSVRVDLDLAPQVPPPVLYHGTASRHVDSILCQRLRPQARLQVHLSVDAATARRVGRRHGRPVVLKVDALRMHANGCRFHLADNGVWLTDQVPPEFLTMSSSPEGSQ